MNKVPFALSHAFPAVGKVVFICMCAGAPCWQVRHRCVDVCRFVRRRVEEQLGALARSHEGAGAIRVGDVEGIWLDIGDSPVETVAAEEMA